MKTRVRYNLYTKTKKQFVSVTASLVLALASIGGSVPLFLSQKAFAVSPDYTNQAFTADELTNWHADRATPSGGYSSTSYAGRDNVLEMNIDNGNANSDDVFSQTEGLQRSLPSQSESIKASLYVDGDNWDGKQVRAGLWGVGHTADSSDASAFPIIEYTTVGDDGFVGWRVWDSVNGGWTNLDEVDASTGWHDLAISLNKNQHDFGVFVDGSYVGDTPADDGETDVTDSLSAVILNSRNFATHNSDDNYSVHWSDFGYGNFPSTAPQTVYVDSDAYDTTAPFVNDHMVGYDAFATIQEAVDAVAEGGTVNVAAAEDAYSEDLTIDKSVTLIGANELVADPDGYSPTLYQTTLAGQVNGNASQVSLRNFTITGSVHNLSTSHVLNATKNWWGQYAGPTADQHSGLVTVAPWCDSAECSSYAAGQTISLEPTNGVAQTPDANVTLSGTPTAGGVSAFIPANTTITSDPNWDGTVKVPTATSFTVPGAASTGLAISVGSDDYSLTFDKPVELFFPGQNGKSVGFKSHDGVFTPINAVCNSLSFDSLVMTTNECKIDTEDGLVVWTKHFTTFATFTPATVSSPTSATSSTGSKSSTSTKTTTTKSTGHPVGGVATTTGISNVIAEVLGSSNGIKATTTKAAKAPVTHTATATTTNDRFLGLGWYWFVVLAVMVLGTFGYYRLMVIADRD